MITDYLQQAWNVVKTSEAYSGWTPFGVVLLYFYGMFHFNSPDYRLTILQHPDTPALLTLAPPRYTTSRQRFRRYAWRYTLILEVVFLIFIMFPGIVRQSAGILHIDIKDLNLDTVQTRALIALFGLTGLLSSFPIAKQVDGWLLGKLHQAALIPDDARLMARRLFEANFQPTNNIRSQVHQSLISRDMIRYVEGKVSGNLEQRVASLLWLSTQVKDRTNQSSSEYFASRFAVDIADMERNFDRLRRELLSYFRDQAKLVPETAADIDQFLSDHHDSRELAELANRRDDLQQRCDNLYYRVCLLAALLAYSTESSADDIGTLLGKIGFAVKVSASPILDWDAVTRVVGSVFVLTVVINICFTTLAALFHPGDSNGPEKMMALTVVTTLLYFIVVFVALKFKRHWRRRSSAPVSSENPMLAVICYCIALLISLAIRIYILEMNAWSPAPFVFALNQGVVGYFIGVYVDRSLTGQPFSWNTAATQCAIQTFVAALILYVTFQDPAMDFTVGQIITFGAVFIVQAAISGFMVGVVFQYYYRRTAPARGEVIGDVTVETLQPAS